MGLEKELRRVENRGKQLLHILVVDDSAVVRQLVSNLLSKEPDLRVTVAADPLIAMNKMARDRPHVVLLDLEMPRMDGLTFLRKIMAEDPLPVVICSGAAQSGTEVALNALDAGAVDIVAKPQMQVGEFLRESVEDLIDTLRAAAVARVRPRSATAVVQTRKIPVPTRPSRRACATDRANHRSVIAIGASTGGPAALRTLLAGLQTDTPATVIVQHMPETFTGALAKRLDELCEIEVREASDGDEAVPGRALIAPGDRHMMLVRSGARYTVSLVAGPRVNRHRPSVDVLFHSVTRAVGHAAIGVLLTGMGEDGAAGLLEMKQAGAVTLAQDEKTCVVFGMPKRAIERGAVDEVVPIDQVPGRIRRVLGEGSR